MTEQVPLGEENLPSSVEEYTEETQKLLQKYENAFPRKKPLKRLPEALSEQGIDQSVETKKIKVSTKEDADFTTIKDVEDVKNALEQSTATDFISSNTR